MGRVQWQAYDCRLSTSAAIKDSNIWQAPAMGSTSGSYRTTAL